MFTYEQAIKENLYKDCLLVSLQPKSVPIHKGHIKLIEFAKTLGNVVVWITRQHIRYMTHVVDGHGIFRDDSDVTAEVNSLEQLGVSVVVKDCNESLVDNPKIKKLVGFYARDLKDIFTTPALKEIVIPPHKVRSCKMKLIEYAMIPKDLGIKAIVRGPEFENFIVKSAWTKHPRPPIVIFPKVVKDKYGLQYRTTHILTESQIETLREMVGSNAGKVTVYEGVVFGGKLELIEYIVPHEDGKGSNLIEESNYAPV